MLAVVPMAAVALAVVAAIAFAAMLTFLIIESEGETRGCLFQGVSISLKIFLARTIASLAAQRGFGDASFMEKFLLGIGVTYELADSFIPDTPVQDCVL